MCLTEDGENGEKAGILRETLAVNFFGALGVAEACLPALTSAATTPTAVEAAVEAAIATTTGRSASAAVMTQPAPPTVVWISSGEGELCFLGAKWRSLLAKAESLEVRGASACGCSSIEKDQDREGDNLYRREWTISVGGWANTKPSALWVDVFSLHTAQFRRFQQTLNGAQ